MKHNYIESSKQSWRRIVSEVESLGALRTEISLVDIWGENPGTIVHYYKFSRCGEPLDGTPPTLGVGFIAINRYHPLAFVIKDISHDEFVMIAEQVRL